MLFLVLFLKGGGFRCDFLLDGLFLCDFSSRLAFLIFPNFHGIDFDPVGAGCSRAIFSLDGLFLCDCLIDLVFPIFRILMLLILTLYGPVVHVRFSSRSVVSVRFCFRFGFCQHSEV